MFPNIAGMLRYAPMNGDIISVLGIPMHVSGMETIHKLMIVVINIVLIMAIHLKGKIVLTQTIRFFLMMAQL